MKLNWILILVLCCCVKFCSSQELIGEFKHAIDGEFLADDRLVLICNECDDLPSNTVAFYDYDGYQWSLYDSLTTMQYYPDMSISRLSLSKDKSTLRLMLYDPNNTLVNDDDDLLLVFKKRNNTWVRIFTRTDLTDHKVGDESLVNIALSYDGNILVIGYTNLPPGAGGNSSKIITEIYNYKNEEYSLVQTIEEDIYCRDSYYLKYLTETNDILISPKNEFFERERIFIKYSLIDSNWVKVDDYLEVIGEPLDLNIIEDNLEGDEFILARSNSSSIAHEKTIELEHIEVDENNEINRTVIFRATDPEFRLFNMSASDNLEIVSTDIISNLSSSENDTTQYIDYLQLDNNIIVDSYRFSYPVIDPMRYSNDLLHSRVSPSGRYILFRRAKDTYVYDMEKFLSSTEDLDGDDSYVQFHLSDNIIHSDQSDEIKIYDLIGRLVIEDTASSIDVSTIPSGMYVIHFLRKGKILGVEKVMKI